MGHEQSTIVVFGAAWCPDAQRARHFLEDRCVAFTWRDVDEQAEAAAFVRETNRGEIVLPTIVFPDGSILVEPSNEQLRAKLDELDGAAHGDCS